MSKIKCHIKSFCYVCGLFMANEGAGDEGHGFTKEFIEMYESYFPFEKVRTTARWLPKRYCNGCHTALWKWWNEKPGQKTLHLKYAAPMGWPLVDPLEHKPEQCYGCVNFGKGGLTKIKAKAKVYESVPGVSLPVLYEEGMVVPKRPTLHQMLPQNGNHRHHDSKWPKYRNCIQKKPRKKH